MSLEEENGQNEQPNSEELKKLLRLKRDELRNKCTALNILFDMKDKKKALAASILGKRKRNTQEEDTNKRRKSTSQQIEESTNVQENSTSRFSNVSNVSIISNISNISNVSNVTDDLDNSNFISIQKNKILLPIYVLLFNKKKNKYSFCS